MEQLDLAYSSKAYRKQPKQKKMAKCDLVVYLRDNQKGIISGDVPARQMMNDTGWNRATIKKVALANDLAYKKEEKQSYFSVPLGPWNRPLGKCL